MKLNLLIKNPLTYIIFSTIILTILSVIIFIQLNHPKLSKKVEENKTEQETKTSQKLKGVSISPKSYSTSDFVNFFTEAKKVGNSITWSGEWGEFLQNAQTPTNISKLGSQNSLEVIFITGTYNQGEKKVIRRIDTQSKNQLVSSISKFTQEVKPNYLGLGVEINVMAKYDPTEFEKFVDLFTTSVQKIKEKSPRTKVFTIFQLETMNGLSGGLFGGSNDTTKNQWALLDRFSEADFFAFTTYPSLIYKDPSEIPVNYYSDIKSKTQKQIAFSEIGWPSESSIKGWESSETKQAEFINRFKELTSDLNPNFVIWSFLYDPDTKEPFKNMGLIQKNSKKKEGLSAWISY